MIFLSQTHEQNYPTIT